MLVVTTTVLGAAVGVLQRRRSVHPWRSSHLSVTSQRSNNDRHPENFVIAVRRSESVEATALWLFAEPDRVRSDILSVTHYTDCVGDTVYCEAEIEGDDLTDGCFVNDHDACSNECTEDDEICDELCGKWCENGAGAICGLTVFSNLGDATRRSRVRRARPVFFSVAHAHARLLKHGPYEIIISRPLALSDDDDPRTRRSAKRPGTATRNRTVASIKRRATLSIP